VICHASKKGLKEKQLRAQCAVISVSVCNCGSFVFTRHASRPVVITVSNRTRGLTIFGSGIMSRAKLTLQPLVNSKPAGARDWSVCPRKYPVRRRSRSITASTSRVSHLQSILPLFARGIRHCNVPMPAEFAALQYTLCIHFKCGYHILCLSHWSTECLGLLPPFCMFLIFERPAPETPKNCNYIRSVQQSCRSWVYRVSSLVGVRTASCEE
jgi:hypothetical protein